MQTSSEQETLLNDLAIDDDTDDDNRLHPGEAEQLGLIEIPNSDSDTNDIRPGDESEGDEDANVDGKPVSAEKDGDKAMMDEDNQTTRKAVHSKPEKAAPKAKVKKATTDVERLPGKSLLPFASVQRIIKADEEIPIVAKEATFLISLATEEFIKKLCEAARHVAEQEKRSTIQHKDIATVVRRADEFLFLEELMPWISPDPVPKRSKPKTKASESSKKDGPTMLDQFVGSNKGKEMDTSEDIIMNDDGTMYAAGVDDNADDDFE